MANEGARELQALGLKQAEVAAAVGTTQSVVSRWERGEKKPGTPYRVKLQEIYGIDWQAWDREIDSQKAS